MAEQASITPLDQEKRTTLPTAEAARHLNRTPATLTWWSHTGKGPLQPVKVNGRLAWPVADIKRLLGVEVQS